MKSTRTVAGFTLIEVLVAAALFAVVFVGVLQMLESSTRLSKVESSLADTQENVRYAAYHLVRTARMVGGTSLPLARNDATFQWVSLQVLDNHSGAFNDDLGHSHNATAGSDVVTLRGFFEHSPYFIDSGQVDFGSNQVTVYEQPTSPNGVVQDLVPVAPGKGIVLMGRNQYAVATVKDQADPTGTAPNRTLVIAFEDRGGIWQALNPGGVYTPPAFQIFRVGILEDYTYYVTPDGELRRWRASDANSGQGTDEPVAQNIGSLQVALGLDVNDDGFLAPAEWFYSSATPNPPSNADAATAMPIALRVAVLGRTPFSVPDWLQPAATFAVEDMTPPTGDARRAKWRTLQVQATLRDFVLRGNEP